MYYELLSLAKPSVVFPLLIMACAVFFVQQKKIIITTSFQVLYVFLGETF